LIIVEDKVKVLEMEELLKSMADTAMTVYGVHDKGIWNTIKFQRNRCFDWNSNKLSEMFTMAGFNVNRLKMFILDDADPILRLRHETNHTYFKQYQ
jgi:hypothetical protein